MSGCCRWLRGAPPLTRQHYKWRQSLLFHSSFSTPSTHHPTNPFRVLGVTRDTPFSQVQKAFVKLALEHHPDTAQGGQSSNSTKDFVTIRKAFEDIRKAHVGNTKVDYNEDEPLFTEQDFLQWFYEQTGLKLTSEQRRDLVELHRNRIPGKHYGGQAWAITQLLVQEQDAFLRAKVEQEQGLRRPDVPRPPRSPRGPNPEESSPSKNLRRKRKR